jgi:hypothetical protein
MCPSFGTDLPSFVSPIRMRLLSLASVVLAFALSAALGVAPAHGSGSPHSIPGFSYVSPAPDSKLLRPENNIIVRPGGQVDPVSLTASTITVTGTLSGDHPGTLRLSENGATILFRPATPFSYGESVTCTIAPGIHATPGGELPGASFTFQVAPPPAPASLAAGGGGLAALLGDIEAATVVPAPARSPAARTDSIGMPSYELSVTGTTAPGALFVSDFRFDDPLYPSHLLILRNDGTAAFQKPLANQGLDFKLQPDHRRVTYFDGDRGYYYVMNANGAVIDSLQPGNGYPIDLHELVLLPNGHALLMSYDPQPLDMSTVVEGGNPNAVVVGLVIQELDQEKDVVFQWRSWDHFQITDCVRSITGANVDYAHGNSIEPDTDGNLIFSSRHMDEITKVSRETGEIIWRLGGKNNQFTFVNDPDQFSQQHSARRLANGHLLLYDNGNFHTPPRSRAVEYTLDEVHRVATLVWQYRNTPDTFGGAMGSVQRLPNGNTLIGWGATNPTATEVAPDGRKVAEMTFAPGTFSYRAFRFEWPPVVPVATRPSLETIDVETKDQTVTVVLSSDVFEGEEIDLTSIRLAGAVSPISHHVPSEPVSDPSLARGPSRSPLDRARHGLHVLRGIAPPVSPERHAGAHAHRSAHDGRVHHGIGHVDGRRGAEHPRAMGEPRRRIPDPARRPRDRRPASGRLPGLRRARAARRAVDRDDGRVGRRDLGRPRRRRRAPSFRDLLRGDGGLGAHRADEGGPRQVRSAASAPSPASASTIHTTSPARGRTPRALIVTTDTARVAIPDAAYA